MDSDSPALSEAIRLCLNQWPAMQLVRSYHQDAEEQLSAFAQEIESYMQRFEVDTDYLCDFLSGYLDEHFSIDVDDGSLEVIARVLVTVQAEEERGSIEELTKLRSFSKVKLPEVAKIRTDQHADPPIESLTLSDPPALEEAEAPEPDADGFVTVTGKKPRRKG